MQSRRPFAVILGALGLLAASCGSDGPLEAAVTVSIDAEGASVEFPETGATVLAATETTVLSTTTTMTSSPSTTSTSTTSTTTTTAAAVRTPPPAPATPPPPPPARPAPAPLPPPAPAPPTPPVRTPQPPVFPPDLPVPSIPASIPPQTPDGPHVVTDFTPNADGVITVPAGILSLTARNFTPGEFAAFGQCDPSIADDPALIAANPTIALLSCANIDFTSISPDGTVAFDVNITASVGGADCTVTPCAVGLFTFLGELGFVLVLVSV